MHDGSLHAATGEATIPPFLVFTTGSKGRDVIFRGLAAPGVEEQDAAHCPNSKLEAAYHKVDAAVQNIVELLAAA